MSRRSMRNKHCQSAEDVFSTNASKIFRYNPRIPCKMKGTRNNLRTFGLNHQRISSVRMDPKNVSPIRIPTNKGEDRVEDMTPWERLRDSFSISPTLINLPQNHIETTKDENQNQGWIPCKKSSSTAVQVNMFHCGECRRHIKYGKQLTQDKSGSESETEPINTESLCISCRPACAKTLICERIKEEDECSRGHEECQKEGDSCDHNKSTDIVVEDDKLNANIIPDGFKQVLSDDKMEVLTPEDYRDGTLEKVLQIPCCSDSQISNIRYFIFLGLTLSLVIIIMTNNLHITPSVRDFFIYLKRRIISEEPRSYLQKFSDYFLPVTDYANTYSLVMYFF